MHLLEISLEQTFVDDNSPDGTSEVLRTLASAEKPIGARAGRWYMVRVMPYRTADDRIDGVVITFADITTAKKLEAQLRATQAGLEKQVANKTLKPEPKKRRPER